MPVQRACAAEKQTGNSSSRKVWLCVIFSRNGPLRVQGTAALLLHSILQRRAYVSCRGCVGIPPSAWGRSHEVRVAPRIKGQALFALGRRAGGVFCLTQKGEAAMKIRPALDEARAIAAAGDYNVLPVSGEILRG